MKINNFYTRTLSGFVYVAIVVGSIQLGLNWVIPFLAFVCAFSLWEFYRPTMTAGSALPLPSVLMGSSLFLILSFWLRGMQEITFYLPYFMLAPYLLLVLGLFKPGAAHFKDTGIYLLGLAYVVLPLASLIAIGNQGGAEDKIPVLLGVFLLFWTNDTGAYLAGKSFGKHPLFPSVSPKKTIEGLVGGILLTLAIGWLITLFNQSFSLTDWLIIAVIVSVFGTLGDLVESMWKRSLNLKDSGNIMPGHGGMLDRFDGIFIAAPVIFFYLIFIR